MTKKTIGNNPLFAYINSTQKEETSVQKKEEVAQTATQRVTIHIDVSLINAVKDAVFWEPGLTLTAFTHDAFCKELERLEKSVEKSTLNAESVTCVGGGR